MPTKKLTQSEISERRETANEYKVTIEALKADLVSVQSKVKAVKRQIAESTSYFNDLVVEIITGEVELDPQEKLPL
jgi:chromosome segregation ATPase